VKGWDEAASAFGTARRYFRCCAGFRTLECGDHPRAVAANVREAPRQEIAVGGAAAVRRALWGIGGESWGAELGLERLRQWVCGKAWMGASV
jgi:hypothetical protein